MIDNLVAKLDGRWQLSNVELIIYILLKRITQRSWEAQCLVLGHKAT